MRRGRVPLRRVFDPAITPDDRLEPQITARAISTPGVRQLRLDTPEDHRESPRGANPLTIGPTFELRSGDRPGLSRPLEILLHPTVALPPTPLRALLHRATHGCAAFHPHGSSVPHCHRYVTRVAGYGDIDEGPTRALPPNPPLGATAYRAGWLTRCTRHDPRKVSDPRARPPDNRR